jgi:hypothetical protein
MVDAMEAVLLCAAPISGGLCAKSGTLVAKRPCTLVKTASQYSCRSGLVGVIGSANRLAHRKSALLQNHKPPFPGRHQTF